MLEAEGDADPEALAEVFDGDPNTSFYGTPGLLPSGDSETITAPDGVQSGVYAVNNTGEQPSDFNVAGPTDAQVGDFDAAIGAYFGSIGTGEVVPLEFPAPLVAGFSESMPPGATGYVIVDLEKGRYIIGGNSDDDTGETLVSGEFEVS